MNSLLLNNDCKSSASTSCRRGAGRQSQTPSIATLVHLGVVGCDHFVPDMHQILPAT